MSVLCGLYSNIFFSFFAKLLDIVPYLEYNITNTAIGGNDMIQYMSAKEAADKWNISQRRVSILCSEQRIPNVAMLGNMWLIPRNAEKPVDARMKRNIVTEQGNARPFVKWAGGKGQLIDILKSNLPVGFGDTITRYAEPFVGGGALLFALLNEYTFEEVYINDNNKELINVFKVIKSDCEKLISKLEFLQEEYKNLDAEQQQEYYYSKRESFNDIELNEETSIEKASLFIFLNKTCFNGLYRVNKAGKFNVPAGKYKNPLICDKDNLRNISNKIKNVVICSCDYHDVENFADENTLVYFDPPYRPLNATSAFTSYTENQFDDSDQVSLAELFKKLDSKGVKVMLSNSDPHNTNFEDNFFDDLFAGYDIQRITATRSINSKAEKRGDVTELLIKNY